MSLVTMFTSRDPDHAIAARAKQSLEHLLREAGLAQAWNETWSPCPECGAPGMVFSYNKPADPLVSCWDDDGGLCGFTFGIPQLRAWLMKGWRVGQPIPYSGKKGKAREGFNDRDARLLPPPLPVAPPDTWPTEPPPSPAPLQVASWPPTAIPGFGAAQPQVSVDRLVERWGRR